MFIVNINEEMANNISMVERIIKSEYSAVLNYIEYDDLFQIGLEGLWIGIKSFNGQVAKDTHFAQNIRMKIGKEVCRSIERKHREIENNFQPVSITNKEGIDLEIKSNRNDFDGVYLSDTVQQAFDLLDNDTDKLILSMMIEGYNQTEIAQEVGISQQAIRKKIRVVREQLKSLMH